MKKIISFSILAALVFSFVALISVKAEDNTTATSAETVKPTLITEPNATPEIKDQTTAQLEKIPSPDQIKNFKMIKKVGDVLYGIKLERKEINQLINKITGNATSSAAAIKQVESVSTSTNNNLEKISAPSLINLYEKIRQVGTALWGVRKKVPAIKLTVTPEISACVATAINTKDQAVQAKITDVASKLNTAISTRGTCQQEAIKITAEQRDNLNACTKAFQENQKKINSDAKQQQREIWTVYKNSLKECAKNLTSASSTNALLELNIEDGSENTLETVTSASLQ